ncbi:nucleotidyl transferase AbiEii/AbiGii toxin family protein [Fodinibius halophilus]|uniref:nucleotidyl transferase AbiEii/AbiGii toxin family protein n=1 Tax=Fodinibius halophilus TaxID=1736908 RepID=UPI00197AB5D0|nr:nucleotidyl transferase AbiEii/AbiGii toxin family protein [Fodinibius halophilus]
MSSFNHQGLEEVIQTLETVFQKFDVDFYIIGALAKDMWLAQEKIQSRATKDVDLAVFISESGDYDEIKSILIKEHGFEEVSTNAFALLTPYGYPVDLLPFGSVEIDEAVEVEGDGLTKVHVNGFKEIYQEGLAPILTDEGLTFKIASLASIVLLKLIAFDDRPEKRTHDIKDVGIIIHHYFHIEDKLIYDKHNDLFDNENLELEDIAAHVIGRELKPLLVSNKSLQDRTLNILSLSKKYHQRIPELIAQGGSFTTDKIKELFNRIAQGIEQ